MGERTRTEPGEAGPSLFGNDEARFERDPALSPSPEVIGEAAPQPIDPQLQRQLSVPAARAAVAAAQQPTQQERAQALAPMIGETALKAQRRDEISKAVTRQLGYKAVERARARDGK